LNLLLFHGVDATERDADPILRSKVFVSLGWMSKTSYPDPQDRGPLRPALGLGPGLLAEVNLDGELRNADGNLYCYIDLLSPRLQVFKDGLEVVLHMVPFFFHAVLKEWRHDKDIVISSNECYCCEGFGHELTQVPERGIPHRNSIVPRPERSEQSIINGSSGS
jgi:hypothetical protein